MAPLGEDDSMSSQFSSLLGLVDSFSKFVDRSPVAQVIDEAQRGVQESFSPNQVVVIVLEESASPDYDLTDWAQALDSTKQACEADFEAICGDLKGHQLDSHHHHHGGPEGMHHGHDMHHSMDHAKDMEGPHEHRALGFGSMVADKCLRDHLDEAATDCVSAIESLDAIYEDLSTRGIDIPPPPDAPHGHPGHDLHAAGGMCFFLFLLLLPCMCCVTRVHHARHRRRMRQSLRALESNTELRSAVEAAAGTPVPTPGWKCKIHAALEANPELRQELDKAMTALPAPERPPMFRHRGFRIFALVFSVGFIMSLFMGAAVVTAGLMMNPDSTNPAFGFFLTLIVGFLFIKCGITIMLRCCYKPRHLVADQQEQQHEGALEASSSAPAKRTKKLAVYTEIPVDATKLVSTQEVEVTHVETGNYVPPLPVLP